MMKGHFECGAKYADTTDLRTYEVVWRGEGKIDLKGRTHGRIDTFEVEIQEDNGVEFVTFNIHNETTVVRADYKIVGEMLDKASAWVSQETVGLHGNSLVVNVTKACRILNLVKGDLVKVTIERIEPCDGNCQKCPKAIINEYGEKVCDDDRSICYGEIVD